MSSLKNGISVGLIVVDAVSESLWPRLTGLLDRHERQRAARFVGESDRRRQIAAHALKRLMLTACSQGSVLPKSWAFRDAEGRAWALDRAGPHFAVSHCDGLVACGVSRRFRLGIDIKSAPDALLFEFARTQFTEREILWLAQQPADRHAVAFLKLWNLKEAHRNMGESNLAPMPDFIDLFDSIRMRPIRPALAGNPSWHFFQGEVGQRHSLALAWQAGARKVPIEVRMVYIEELLFGIARNVGAEPWRFGGRPGPNSPGASSEPR